MAKKIFLIIILGCGLMMVFIYFGNPLLHRGRIRITIDNQSAQKLVLIGVNEQNFDIVIAPGESCKVRYDVTYVAGIEMKLRHDNVVISTELVEYVEPAYYGTIQVNIVEALENEFEIEVKSRIDF